MFGVIQLPRLEWTRHSVTVFVAKHKRCHLLPGENHREHVIDPSEEQKYLAVASGLLGEVATVLFDSGMRPEECYRLRWEKIAWVNGRHGTMFVSHGKTKAARRTLPMSPRVRAILEARWNEAGRPLEGWVWRDDETRSGHIEPSTLKKPHRKAIKLSKVRPFVLYSTRHTFATRLAPYVDPWTLCRVMGWSDVKIAMRYIHPSEENVLAAIEGLQRESGSRTSSSPIELDFPRLGTGELTPAQ